MVVKYSHTSFQQPFAHADKLKACLAELATINSQLDLDKKPEPLIIDEEENEPEDENSEEEILELEDGEEYEDAI